MSAEGNGGYALHLSTFLARRLRKLHREAAERNQGRIFVESFRTIVHRLETNPLDFGEPLYRLPGMRMEVRTGVVSPIVVDFAVCQERPLVFIKGVKLLKGKTQA
jgi:hypothetical protein